MRFASEVVAVIEDLGAGLLHRDHRLAVHGHRRARLFHVPFGVLRAQGRSLLKRIPTRHIPVERIMRARLIGNDVQDNTPPYQLRINVGGVPDQPDAEHLPIGAGLFDERESIIQRIRDLHEITGLDTPTDAVDVDIHAQRDPLVHLDCERLRPAHPAEPGREHDAAEQRPPAPLARERTERFVRPLHDPLRADVDPRTRRHLPVHRQAGRFELPELLPRGPLRHQQRVRDQHARRERVRLEDADRLARLDEQRLVAFERTQGSHDRVERRPISSSLPAAAVHDQIIGPLGDVGVEVVVEHPERSLLRPAFAADLCTAWRAHHGTCHGSGPITPSAALTTTPPRTISVTVAISGASGLLKPADESPNVPEEIATFRREFDDLLHKAGIKQLVVLIDDLDRCLPDNAIETLEAAAKSVRRAVIPGTARRLHCDTIEACVYCASMKPEFTPGSGTRNAGSPFECAGSSMRSVLRSLIEAISDAAIARKSSANATGSPWKLPALSTVPSSCKTTGLSTSLDSSASATRIA